MLKDSILADLIASPSLPVSGQDLANRHHVSRNAVWKAVNTLKADGYSIESVKNKGYILKDCPDKLSAAYISQRLKRFSDLNIFVFSELDSTNNEAKRMLSSGYDKTALIISDAQTAGRGRRGRRFYSPANTGLYLSLIVPVAEESTNPTLLTTAAAVAVLRGVQQTMGLQLQIKWINDLFYHGKKAGGILTEAISDLETGQISHAVVGIGLNLHTNIFPPELSSIATGLSLSNVSRNELSSAIAIQLLTMNWQSPETYLPEYIHHSLILGQTVCYQGEPVTALEILPDGGLLIQHQDGRKECLKNGEIQFLSHSSLERSDLNSNLAQTALTSSSTQEPTKF